MRVAHLLFFPLVAFMASCALFTDLDGYSGGDRLPDGGDAGADATPIGDAGRDAPADTDAADAGSPYAAAVLEDRPVVYLRFDETSGEVAKDETGEHDGSYEGDDFVLGVPGLLSGDPSTAVSLGGESARILLGDVDDLLAGDDPFTVEAWIAPESLQETQWIIGRDKASDPPTRYGVSFILTPEVTLERWLGGDNDRLEGGPVAISEPNHVVATSDGGAVRVWTNGIASEARTITLGAIPAEQPIVIGAQSTQVSGFFHGIVDEVALYDHALSSARIAAHYDLGKPR